MATNGRTALITGASSGIGLELTRVLAREGHDVVLVARSRERLEAIGAELSSAHGIQHTVIPADLAEPGAVDAIVRMLEERRIAVDVLVNNAGFGSFGPFVETDPAGDLAMLQVNVVALTALTRRLLPGMVQRGHGRVLNVASTAAFQPGPLMSVYYATKAYVLSFSEALAEELDGTGVTVTALCPGPTESGFQARARMEDSKLVHGKRIMDSATVAEAGYAAMQKGKRVFIPGLKNRVMAQSVRFLPRKAVATLVRRLQERAHA